MRAPSTPSPSQLLGFPTLMGGSSGRGAGPSAGLPSCPGPGPPLGPVSVGASLL